MLGYHKDYNSPIHFTVTVKQHILILGPPAVGKLTVAKYLSKQVNYPVFDNAKTVDIALLLHEYTSDKYRTFRDELRLLFYREAAANGDINGLISTNCLRHPKNWEYFTSVEKLFNRHGWSTIYFLLTAEKNILMERAASADRTPKMSLNSRDAIESWFSTSPFHSQPQDHLCYSIDTTKMTVEEVAEEILRTLTLFHQQM